MDAEGSGNRKLSLTPQVMSFGLSLKLMKLLPDFLRNVAKCDSLVHCCSFYQVRVQFLPGKFLIIFNWSVMIYCQIKTTDTLLPWSQKRVHRGKKKIRREGVAALRLASSIFEERVPPMFAGIF